MTLAPVTLIPMGGEDRRAEGLAGGHSWVSFQAQEGDWNQGIDGGFCPSGQSLLLGERA